ncbi:MAG: hypothetical protein JXA20_16995 [Spirochaetes bacterium]|nr:hypothetical protein [Spirochaetota bacterium]
MKVLAIVATKIKHGFIYYDSKVINGAKWYGHAIGLKPRKEMMGKKIIPITPCFFIER